MSQMKKILLVEDNEIFRETIKKSLERKSFEVLEAPDGKAAREMLLLHKVDLVISDIQMPHFSGLDLLEWVKKNQTVPVVLMTGFSQALETKRADEIGAAGFLPKPFKESHLFEVLNPLLGPQAPPAAVDMDKLFCKVSIEDFVTEREVEYGIYIRVSNAKYIKIAHTGGKLSEERIKAYKDKGVIFVYVRKEDFSKVVRFNLKVARVAQASSTISIDKKINFIRSTGELILEDAFVNGVNATQFNESKEFIETCMGALTEDDQVFTVLEILSAHADFLYAHSLGVSTFAVMIAREMGWTSTQTLFKLATGGLFHDIGKKEIDREILEKPRPTLNQRERALIETHPKRGKEILEAISTMPSDVGIIAYQHHEDSLGQGYPAGKSKNEIHPLAKVVQVANIFCEYAVKCRPDTTPIAGTAAIALMSKMRADELDRDAFSALKRLFAVAA